MSEIRANTVSDAAGTGPATLTGQYAAKASWSYDQTGPTVQASKNISSITDNLTGNYTINFTNSFANAFYSWTGGTYSNNGTGVYVIGNNTGDVRTTSACDLNTEKLSASNTDIISGGAVHGDLA